MNKTLVNKIEINKKLYKRLLKNRNYTDVRFNPKTGALSAIHKEHCFDHTIGIFGIPRGDYERITVEILFDYGRCVILESENKDIGTKTPEGLLDGKKFEIKGIEGTGKRNIITKISDASKQGVETVVLYFHDMNMFDLQKIINAYNKYLKLSKSKRIHNVYYIVDNKLHKIEV